MPIITSKGEKSETNQSHPFFAKTGPSLSQLLSVEQAANLLGVSVSWLNKARGRGDGPPFHKIGRRVLYDAADVIAWLSQRKRCHTSASAA